MPSRFCKLRRLQAQIPQASVSPACCIQVGRRDYAREVWAFFVMGGPRRKAELNTAFLTKYEQGRLDVTFCRLNSTTKLRVCRK